MLEILEKGGLLMTPILLASVVSVTLTLERVLFWMGQRSEVAPEDIIKLVSKGTFDKALKMAEGAKAASIMVLKEGLLHRNPQPRLAMEAEALKSLAGMNKNLSAMDTIITLAPLLGLLGTIIGMIQSFGIISETGLGNPNAVTGGVAEALIVTAAGIFVAVSTLIPHNYFLSKSERAAEEMEMYATKMEVALDLGNAMQS